MLVLVAILLLVSIVNVAADDEEPAAHVQLHEDYEYLFFIDELNADEFAQISALFFERMVKAKDPKQRSLERNRVVQMLHDQAKIIRVTRQNLPSAFERLVKKADDEELKKKEEAKNAEEGVKSISNFITSRKLLALDDEEVDDDAVDEAEIGSLSGEAKAIIRGGNGNHKHCESGREVAQLATDKIPDLSTLHPALNLHIDEEEGTIHFTVEVPYIPFDARYVISFDPIEHSAENPLTCSSNYEGELNSTEQHSKKANIWGHAPNANYRDAFSSKKEFAAYYSSPQSKWLPQASGCSHVKYGATFTVSELTECSDGEGNFAIGLSQLATSIESSAVSMIGIVWVSLLQPSSDSQLPGQDTLENAVVVAKWAHPFSLTIDERDSKIILADSANGGIRSVIEHTPIYAKDSQGSTERPRAATIMRKASITKDGLLELNLQTQFAVDDGEECEASSLSLAQILWREFEMAEAPVHDSPGAYCVKVKNPDGKEEQVVLQDWRIRSKKPLDVYDGDFVLLFCDFDSKETDNTCDETNAIHRTTLGVRMSKENSETTEQIAFHSEITQHVSVSDEETKVHSGAYDSGDRACMQSYVIGPKQLTSQIEVKIVEAWLCTSNDGDDKTSNKDELQCKTRPHAVQLVGTNPNTTEVVLNSARNVTVHHPGVYGLLSVGVCFDVNARFIDGSNRSVIEKNQRYESKVKMQPATIRRIGAIHITPMFFTVERLIEETDRSYDVSIEALSTHAEDQSLQAAPFVAAVLRKTIDSARESGLVEETHAHEFKVLPTDVDDPVVSETESAVAIALTLLIMLAFGLILYFCVLSSNRFRFV